MKPRKDPQEEYKKKLALVAKAAMLKREQERVAREIRSMEFLDFGPAIEEEIRNVSIGK